MGIHAHRRASFEDATNKENHTLTHGHRLLQFQVQSHPDPISVNCVAVG